MPDNRLILGIYLEPRTWLVNNEEEVNPSTITPQECLQVVFSKELPNGIEICVQRQGFLVAAIPEELMSIRISERSLANVLPMSAARFALDFFNAFLYLFYDQMQRNGRFHTIKQVINIADIWEWRNRADADLVTIAIGQPMEAFNQHSNSHWSLDNVLPRTGKTMGWLGDNDKLFRLSLPVNLIDNTFDAMFFDTDYLLNWQLMTLLNKAVLSTQRGEFAEAHILSWAVVEKLIQVEWKNFTESTNEIFEDGTRTVNSKRKEILDSRGFTASARIEVLELAKVISHDMYRQLGSIRKVRNNWMHNLSTVSLQDCRACYLAARDLLSAKIKFPLQHAGGNYMQDEDFRPS